MSEPNVSQPVTSPRTVERIARSIADAGRFALDLEFVSESRYQPELALVQVGWGDPEDPEIAAVDPVAVDVEPLAELVAAPEVQTVLHAGQGDLALLGQRFDIVGQTVVDTQIAAAFVGVGDQIGYAGLVAEVLGLELDKAMQFTDWLERPLSDEQIRYALDDVRYLLKAWDILRDRLLAEGRLRWVEEESATLAREADKRLPAEEAYRKVKGWQGFKPQQRAVIRVLAEWRENRALKTNKPPSWILKDQNLKEIARRLPEGRHALLDIQGVGQGTVRRHGGAILSLVEEGRKAPAPPIDEPPRRFSERERKAVSKAFGALQERCREVGIAPRFVASRGEVNLLSQWILEGASGEPPELRCLSGWRRELAGEELLADLKSGLGRG